MPDYVWHRNKVLRPDVEIFFRTTAAQSKYSVFFAMSLRIFLKNPQWHCGNFIHFLEVSAVIGDARVAIEIKSTDSVQASHKKGLAEFAKEHPNVRQIIVSRDRVTRRSGDVDLYYVTDFFKELWEGKII